MKNIYFVSESLPLRTYGSFAVFYRHLKRLEKSGYAIHLVIPDYDQMEKGDFYQEYLKTWQVTRVPFKRWWFLPYRANNGLLRLIRFIFLLIPIYRKVSKNRPDYIISYVYLEYLNAFAIFLSKLFKCKLGVFLHDDKSLMGKTEDPKHTKFDQYLAKSANVIWTVSDRLKIKGFLEKKYITLRPIPEGNPAQIYPLWHSQFEKPVIGFAGRVYDAYIPVFQKLAQALASFNGTLVLITNHIDIEALICQKYQNVRIVPPFDYNDDASDYLKKNCSALYCGYPDDLIEMPWLESCFPSKFVEFTHLGLPIILSGPNHTALSDWVTANGWELYNNDLSITNFEQLLLNVTTEKSWQRNADQARQVADNEFNPEHIQMKFEESLDFSN